MYHTFPQYQESAAYIRGRIGSFTPQVAMILGSGLGFPGRRGGGPHLRLLPGHPPLQGVHRPPATRASWCSAPSGASGWR